MLFSYLPFAASLLVASAKATTISTDTLSILQRVSGYAGAAYCPENYGYPADKPTTFPPNPFDTTNSTQIAFPFFAVGKSETTGFIMLDHVHNSIAITFRGTTDEAAWHTNLDFFPTDDFESVCGKDCYVHRGFLHAWNDVSDMLLQNWTELQSLYPLHDTIITGHSLGGALAHLCAAALKQKAPKALLSLYTYASPRVGNQVFANYINRSYGNNNYRVTHLNDPVPRLPGQILGFMHSSPEYHMTSPHIKDALSASKATLARPTNMIVRPEDVLVLPGPENEKGNLGYNCTNVDIHDEYFFHIADCVADTGTPSLGTVVEDICRIFLLCCDEGIKRRSLMQSPGGPGCKHTPCGFHSPSITT